MKIFNNKTKLLKEISKIKDIAFVPTMGSIHKGHLSLISRAKKESKNVLVSIYVNPKQFDSSSDYQKYPRNIKRDVTFLKETKIQYLYLPTYKDIYTFKPKKSIYLNKFSKKLCGKYKPGHFEGVINVVNRLIETINPRSIFLGFKDFQQLALIKLHINKNKMPIKVIACPTIRHSNGVALSSRNVKLNKDQINIANKVYKYLKNNKKEILSKNSKKKKLEFINKIILFGVKKIDYLESVNLKTLGDTKKTEKNSNIFIAYYIDSTRLIDNL